LPTLTWQSRAAPLDTKFVNHEVRVMKNVTISMDEATLAWVRVEAAKAGMSVSKWVGHRLTALRNGSADADAGWAAWLKELDDVLDGPGFDLELEKHPFNREEIYEERLRGLERGRVQPGSRQPAQAGRGEGVAEAARGFEGDDPQHSSRERGVRRPDASKGPRPGKR
jgi:hypothetical protein